MFASHWNSNPALASWMFLKKGVETKIVGIRKSFKILNKNSTKLIFNISLVSVITFYIFFVRIPHCCNLQKSGITLYGGIINKTIAITNVVVGNANNSLFNLDARFRD